MKISARSPEDALAAVTTSPLPPSKWSQLKSPYDATSRICQRSRGVVTASDVAVRFGDVAGLSAGSLPVLGVPRCGCAVGSTAGCGSRARAAGCSGSAQRGHQGGDIRIQDSPTPASSAPSSLSDGCSRCPTRRRGAGCQRLTRQQRSPAMHCLCRPRPAPITATTTRRNRGTPSLPIRPPYGGRYARPSRRFGWIHPKRRAPELHQRTTRLVMQGPDTGTDPMASECSHFQARLDGGH